MVKAGVGGGNRRGVAALGHGFEGQILLPGDDGYDRARRVWNAIVDRRPAVIARCASAAGVAAAVRYGRDRGLEIGVRGGGGNFGIVTEFEFRLHPAGTTALVADLFYRPQDAPEAMQRWRDLLADAPAQATFTASASTSGDKPFLPPEQHNKPLISVGYVWAGDPDQGRLLLPALRRGTRPVAERAQAMTYLQLQRSDDTPQGHHRRRYWKGHYLRQLADDAITAFISRGGQNGDGGDLALLASGDLQAYGGAIAAVGHDETAFSHRDAVVEFVARAGWTNPAQDQERITLARRYGAAIEPFASGVYVNDLTDEGQAGVQRAYGADKVAGLAALKDHYDPLNVFHLNHNILPVSRHGGE